MTRNLIWILIGGAVIWAGLSADISTDKLSSAAPRLADFLARMFPPDWSVWPEILKGLLETLRIAILGTFFSVILSAGLAVLASEKLFPRLIWRPVRALLAMIRAIPLIVVAMLMVGSVGLGPLPGILAITFHATGMLAKFYAEAIDNVASAPVAALESAGASRAQQLRWGIWPQMAPVVLRDTIFRFELNLRESLVLGIVGAGGIGLYVQTYVRSFQYDKAAAVTFAIIILVLISELVAVIVQRRFS
ncbi:phosphonate ABC transporter, permease protein PhnE [Parasedimentitalea marina]|uniref:Phosphonate ABC transporter, permease protein PhnE n=1 Tax=Parasedimentitalea marina TaxID=2483033 RepID=A0A3T0N1H9_9RHOB|nr:phosphonate ABC transporter, permease protein PhnE [Parasedimentitalea marina]AZV77865.1 phosphonate ABC transporter, permease protein PhnE [Parasedimentitalea marina]